LITFNVLTGAVLLSTLVFHWAAEHDVILKDGLVSVLSKILIYANAGIAMIMHNWDQQKLKLDEQLNGPVDGKTPSPLPPSSQQ
jgi:hypothetical protein